MWGVGVGGDFASTPAGNIVNENSTKKQKMLFSKLTRSTGSVTKRNNSPALPLYALVLLFCRDPSDLAL